MIFKQDNLKVELKPRCPLHEGFYPDEPVRDYFELLHEVTERDPGLMREHNLVRARTWGGWSPAFVRLAPMLYTEEVLEQGERYLKRAEELAGQEREVIQKKLQ